MRTLKICPRLYSLDHDVITAVSRLPRRRQQPRKRHPTYIEMDVQCKGIEGHAHGGRISDDQKGRRVKHRGLIPSCRPCSTTLVPPRAFVSIASAHVAKHILSTKGRHTLVVSSLLVRGSANLVEVVILFVKVRAPALPPNQAM